MDANKPAEIDPSVFHPTISICGHTSRWFTTPKPVCKIFIFQKAGLNILGEERKRYLIIFQNNGELRNGRFYGQFCVVILIVKITNIEFPGEDSMILMEP